MFARPTAPEYLNPETTVQPSPPIAAGSVEDVSVLNTTCKPVSHLHGGSSISLRDILVPFILLALIGYLCANLQLDIPRNWSLKPGSFKFDIRLLVMKLVRAFAFTIGYFFVGLVFLPTWVLGLILPAPWGWEGNSEYVKKMHAASSQEGC
ncbi:hypothetical protein MKZ38_006287 [Zalerion maritima]|uniref:Uncharacterized protein n=1 Tax=Zalerion maritima TaxID=339359 RepID=A0AAD5RP33_9PEZI|nr:hypothetical protein MKZ38_006287 [Zalerion maritima]